MDVGAGRCSAAASRCLRARRRPNRATPAAGAPDGAFLPPKRALPAVAGQAARCARKADRSQLDDEQLTAQPRAVDPRRAHPRSPRLPPGPARRLVAAGPARRRLRIPVGPERGARSRRTLQCRTDDGLRPHLPAAGRRLEQSLSGRPSGCAAGDAADPRARRESSGSIPRVWACSDFPRAAISRPILPSRIPSGPMPPSIRGSALRPPGVRRARLSGDQPRTKIPTVARAQPARGECLDRALAARSPAAPHTSREPPSFIVAAFDDGTVHIDNSLSGSRPVRAAKGHPSKRISSAKAGTASGCQLPRDNPGSRWPICSRCGCGSTGVIRTRHCEERKRRSNPASGV